MPQIKISLKDEDLGVFDEETITLQDAYAIKAASGLSLKPFFEGLNDMDPLSIQTLVWFQKRKQGVNVPLQEIDFVVADLGMEQVVPPTLPTETEAPSVGSETTPSAS
ncbi:MAG: hypothetical protein ACXVXW_00455 [Mycobacteriaceae bacterium]